MSSLNKIRKRYNINTTVNENSLYQQYIDDYKLYFENCVNKVSYEDKYNSNIKGECVILDVSAYNPDKQGDEKYITTLPNSDIKVGMILNLGFAKEYTQSWVVVNKEHLPIPSHDKFKINPLYHCGKLVKANGTEIPFDCKMELNMNKVSEKKLYHSPSSDVTEGDYYYNDVDNEVYLIKSVERNLEFPFANAILCNQELNCKQWDKPIPCYIYNNSYGSKGEIFNIEQISDMDSRANIQVQINDKTKMLYAGFRQIFNNDIGDNDIYEITKVQSVFGKNRFNDGGYFDNVCKYCKAVQEDDFVNGIAYNPKFENQDNPKIKDAYIIGEEEINCNVEKTYEIKNCDDNVVFSLDEDSIDINAITIVSQNGKSCTIKGLKKNWSGQIEARTNDGKLICTYVVYVKSR